MFVDDVVSDVVLGDTIWNKSKLMKKSSKGLKNRLPIKLGEKKINEVAGHVSYTHKLSGGANEIINTH